MQIRKRRYKNHVKDFYKKYEENGITKAIHMSKEHRANDGNKEFDKEQGTLVELC